MKTKTEWSTGEVCEWDGTYLGACDASCVERQVELIVIERGGPFPACEACGGPASWWPQVQRVVVEVNAGKGFWDGLGDLIGWAAAVVFGCVVLVFAVTGIYYLVTWLF